MDLEESLLGKCSVDGSGLDERFGDAASSLELNMVVVVSWFRTGPGGLTFIEGTMNSEGQQ